MKPEISVVIPLYNKERYIRRAIDSVLYQTFPNFECIIIDSSTDGSTDLIKQYDDPRIVHVTGEKTTAARARNRGVQIARSDLIAFLDADDEWQPDHLETLLHLRKKFPDAGIYSTPYVKLRPDGSPMAMFFYGIPRPPWEGYVPDYLRSCSRGDEPVNSSSCAVPRNIFENAGGFPGDLQYGEDQFLWGKISLAHPVAYSWKGLAIYHTEAEGRICDETHEISEHPFSAYLGQELAAGRIPPEKQKECRAYMRRKRYSVFFSTLITRGGTASRAGPPAPVKDSPTGTGGVDNTLNTPLKIIGMSLGRFYHSSVHDAVRRCLCRIYGSYNPGTGSIPEKGDRPDTMSEPLQELRILHRKAIYAGRFGSSLRTINIARLAQEICGHTTVFSMDNAIDFEGTVEGIPVIQEREFRSEWEKIRYYLRAVTAGEPVVSYTKRAFLSPGHSLFQIEVPVLYPLLKKNHISRYILDEQNVNWEMYGFPQTELKQRIYASIAFERDKENEKQALLHASHVLCCSVRDRDLLVGEVAEIREKISVIPNCVNAGDYEMVSHPGMVAGNPEMGRILFVGLMDYAPNVEAARLICTAIAPRSSGCEFIIAGKNPPKLPCHENVRFSGYVDDIRPVIAGADICIAPIQSGSGTRIKILEYMAMGKPVIASSKGAEGIECTDGRDIIIEDTLEKYPEIIRQLLDDEKRCSALGREARRLVREKYDWELYRKPLEKIYRDVME